MPHRHAAIFLLGVAVAAVSLSACSLGTIGGVFSPEPSAAETTAGRDTMAPPDMAGRWLLATDGNPGCAMNFTGAAGGREGTISPEGGCPGRFFTSRQWALEQNAVVIRNHAGELLAHLSVAAADRLVGQGPNGEPVALTR